MVKKTYYAEIQKKYDEKRKRIAASVFNDEYEKIVAHLKNKGFKSVSAYILALVRADMSTAAESVGAAPDDDIKDC